MSQNNDQNRKQQQPDDRGGERMREGRGDSIDRPEDQNRMPRTDEDSDLEDMDEMDEDRDDDLREAGGQNRRRNIG
jgi:hypothetical protein